MKPGIIVFLAIAIVLPGTGIRAQFGRSVVWAPGGDAYYRVKNESLIRVDLPGNKETIIAPHRLLKLADKGVLEHLQISNDGKAFLFFTNAKYVWSYRTRGDYWVYRVRDSAFIQVGKLLPPASLMFAKLSPDGRTVAFVSGNNLYAEDLSTHRLRQLTRDGTRKLINGTFDWVYEQEFDCRDGFRWSPDGKKIAYWSIDARAVKDYLMLNTTDSMYPGVREVTYPVAGEPPSSCRIGVIDMTTGRTRWMDIRSDTGLKGYVPRMEWTPDSKELIVQHLNRLQNVSRLLLCDATSGTARVIYTEEDTAWINIQSAWDDRYRMGGWDWLEGGRSFLWASEKDGWRRLYKIDRSGRSQVLLTPGDYDVIGVAGVNEQAGVVFYMASPRNATQAYLYKTSLSGRGDSIRVSPSNQEGTHLYDASPGAKYALHVFSNYYTYPVQEWITLSDHRSVDGLTPVDDRLKKTDRSTSTTSFFTITTSDGVTMDAWKVMPEHFDSTRKYPVVFFVYTGPAAQTVLDRYGAARNFLYNGDMARDGYIYVSIDNRGTPAPKGAAWRKCVYRKMGTLDIADQAAAAREVLKWPFADTSRVAVWGWSNGGTAALNLLFRYPDIYKTGIAIAAITNYLCYDNVWMERIMGLPQQNNRFYLEGSPITYAHNLKGHLFFLQGTGDDNVHYRNAELLLNELIKDNKEYRFMSFPNRSHDIFEGSGTRQNLSLLYTDYLREYCPGGGR